MLYKVLLVDDDVNIVEGLEQTINWNEYGYEVSGIAFNGREGLEKVLEGKPDVVITDITMPIMDGIEMVRLAKESKPDLKVIFLTCHADFHLAQKAIQLDASKYMVKETLEREELYVELKKLSSQMDEEARQRKAILEMSWERNKNRYIIGDWMMNEILNGKAVSFKQFEDMLEQYGYNMKKERFILSVLEIDRYTTFARNNKFGDEGLVRFVVLNVLEEILGKHDLCGVFSRSGKEYIILFNFTPSLKVDMYDKIKAAAREVQYNVKKVTNNSCTIYISEQTKSIGEIPSIYKKVEHLRIARFYLKDERVLDKSCITSKSHLEETDKNKIYSDIVKEYESCLLEGGTTGIMNIVDEFVKKTCDIRTNVEYVKNIARRMLIILLDYIELYGQYQSGKAIPMPDMNLVNEMDSIYEIGEMIVESSLKAVEVYQKNASIVGSEEISKVLRYLTAHMEEDISMDTMAQYVCMNSSYFSRYFKSRTGENFTDYLSKLRVEKAKSLLVSTNFTIDEISDKVGYVNKAYFMRVFKKFAGCTPGEFRKARK